MPESGDTSDRKLRDLIQKAVAPADRHEQVRALAALARAADARRLVPVFQHLAQVQPDGDRLALEFVSRVPGHLPGDLIKAALPVLASKAAPTPFRVVVAGKMIESVPDDPRVVGPIARALSAGAARSRALERLIHVQSRVETCEALDALIAAADQKVRMRCPRCPARLGRSEFIAHLWQRHRLVYDHGKARDPRGLLEDAVNQAVATSEPEDIDRTYLLSAYYYPEVEPRQVLQALAARGSADESGTNLLLERAAEEQAGLCPVCLSAVADPLPPLPPPASLSEGRLAADGYAVDVTDEAAGRRVRITSPGVAAEVAPDAAARWSPRQVGAGAGLGLVVVALVLGIVLPARLAPVIAGGALLAAWLVYAVVRGLKKPLPDRTSRAVDLAWSMIVPGIGRSPAAVRFLTRLCRASLGIGSAADRTTEVFELAEHAEVLANKGGPYLQLLASARVLEAHDKSRLGRDRVGLLAGVFDPFLRGERPPAYAEAAAETVLASDTLGPGDLRRLGVLLVGNAFDCGFAPMDLATLGRFCPWFRRLVLNARPDLLGLLHVVWRGRHTRPWDAVGAATTVFEIAREEPAAARRLLADEPDALLRVDLGDGLDDVLGGVTVTARGVSVGGFVSANPDAPADVAKTSGGEYRLIFGTHKIGLEKKVPLRLASDLEAWLRYRATRLVPAAGEADRRGAGPRAVGLLASLAVDCPLCGARSLIRSGRLGTPWQAVAGM